MTKNQGKNQELGLRDAPENIHTTAFCNCPDTLPCDGYIFASRQIL